MQQRWERFSGLLVVLALHGVAVYALWHYQIQLTPREAVTLFVDFINPPPPTPREETPKQKPKPKPVEPPPPVPQQPVVQAPVVLPDEPVAPPPPIIEAPAPEPVGPVMLATELSVTCPNRAAPVYPAQARKRGEQGKVVLRVEMDEHGRISAARVETSSGSPWLDNAALDAVKTWRCTPATRNRVPVKAVALQPFDFILKGR